VRELVDSSARASSIPINEHHAVLAESNAQFGIDMKAVGADPATLSHDQLADAAPGPSQRYEEKEKQFGAD